VVFAQNSYYDDTPDYLNKYKPYITKKIITPGIYYCFKQKSPSAKYYNYLYIGSRSYNSTAYYPEYAQYENIIFFKGKGNGRENLIYDYINGILIDTEIDNIDSIVFSNFDEITIKGSHTHEDIHTWNNWKQHEWKKITREEISIKYDIPGHRLNDNYYNKIDVTEEMIGKEIPQKEFEGKSESFFGYLESEENKYFVFEIFERYVIFDFTKFEYYYDEIIISAIYNKTIDEYFIFVDYRDNRGDH
jgi:hypothetical protein